eukprot:COSAG02_NODE_8091_length_2714_cov_1.768260_2_plen_507_part_00
MDVFGADAFELEVVRGASNVANDQSLIELTNAQWRQTMKTYLYSTQQPKTAWYGHLPALAGGYGINMREVNSLLNSRKQAALGNQSAADVWGAAMGTGTGDDEIDRAVISTAFNAQLWRAEARRGPSAATTKPFEVGDSVRRFNMRWKKAALKSNAMKMDQEYKWGSPDDVSHSYVLRCDNAPGPARTLDHAVRQVRLEPWLPCIRSNAHNLPPDALLVPARTDADAVFSSCRCYITFAEVDAMQRPCVLLHATYIRWPTDRQLQPTDAGVRAARQALNVDAVRFHVHARLHVADVVAAQLKLVDIDPNADLIAVVIHYCLHEPLWVWDAPHHHAEHGVWADVAGHESTERVRVHRTQPCQHIRAAVGLVRVASAAAFDIWRVIVQPVARSPRRLNFRLSWLHLVAEDPLARGNMHPVTHGNLADEWHSVRRIVRGILSCISQSRKKYTPLVGRDGVVARRDGLVPLARQRRLLCLKPLARKQQRVQHTGVLGRNTVCNSRRDVHL